jgi:RimK family alpha-L-glutamate ligase
MKLGIFSHAAHVYAPSRFKEEGEKLGLEAFSINYSELDFKISSQGAELFWSDKPLPDFDLVIFRSAGGTFYYVPQRDYLLSVLDSRGAIILNKKTYQTWARLDKLTQHVVFSRKGLPFVETNLYGENERLEKNITYPSVVKVFFGSQGKRVFKVENHQQLEEILNTYAAGNLIVEPVLPEGEDVRVIVLGGKAVGAMKRIAQPGKFLTNFSQGGSVENFPLDEKAKELAEKAAEAFFLEYVGVDLMKDSQGNWRILEVNRACQFEGFEKATGINIAHEVVKYLISKKQK